MLQQLPYSAFERDAFIRTAEVGLSVATRRDLFTWLRLHLHRFVPHDLAICHLLPPLPGHSPTHVFHSVPLDEALLRSLSQSGGRLWNGLRDAWLRAGRQPVSVPLAQLNPCPEREGLLAAGVSHLLVHGVDATGCLRPEMMFAFVPTGAASEEAIAAGLALWMPYLHASAVRALATVERPPAGTSASASLAGAATSALLTAREVQVLTAVRDAKRTTEIAEQLGISPLTVKNHMRKIMGKLGARSRVHAVAEAMTRQIIS